MTSARHVVGKIALVLFAWFSVCTFLGVVVAEGVMHGDHGSIAAIVLAWYAAAIGAALHLLLIVLRRR